MAVPTVSLCIPTYNAAGTLAETLGSILAQDYPSLAIHVIDNASTDTTVSVVESMQDEQVQIYTHAKTVPPEDNWQRCLQVAEGKYTALFHADDLYHPQIVSRAVAILEANPEVGAVFCRATIINEQGKSKGESPTFSHLGFPEESLVTLDLAALVKAMMRNGNFLFTPSAVVRSDIYKNLVGHWRTDLFGTGADGDAWLRIAQQHPIAIVNEPLLSYRRSAFHYSHQYHNARVEPSDLFRVLDHWIDQLGDKSVITEEEKRSYQRLRLFDTTVCAARAVLQNKPDVAANLLQTIAQKQTLSTWTRSVSGLKYGLLLGLVKLTNQLKVIRPLLASAVAKI